MVGSTIPTYHIKHVKLLVINLSTNVPRTKQALGYPKNNNVGKPLKQESLNCIMEDYIE